MLHVRDAYAHAVAIAHPYRTVDTEDPGSVMGIQADPEKVKCSEYSDCVIEYSDYVMVYNTREYESLSRLPSWHHAYNHEFTESPPPEDWRCRICGHPVWTH